MKYGKQYVVLIIAVVIVLVLAVPYYLGYRVGPGIKIERVGILTISSLPSGASVYIDGSLHSTTSKAGDMRDELVAGDHAIIISVPGDYPWNTLAPITSSKPTVIHPLLVSMIPHVTALSGTDKTAAIAAIASSTLPTSTNPIKLPAECAIVYVENNQIIEAAAPAPGCTPPAYLCDAANSCSPTIIFAPVAKLSAVEPYPGRQDAVVLEFGTTLFAIALDPRSPQFFAPILTGTQPMLGALADGTLVVQNGTAVYRLTL